MSFARLLCLSLEVAGMWITASPPNPSPTKQRCLIPNWREEFLRKLAWPCVFLRTIFWLTALTEAMAIVTNMVYLSSKSRRPFIMEFTLITSSFPHALSAERVAVTPLSLLGSMTTFLGAMLRVSCYNTLGKLFTFELSLHRGHRLITAGPYNYIRHPSYTGMIMTIIGVICSNAAKGSWLRESGIIHFPLVQITVAYWLTVAMAVIVSLVLRIPNEDEILRQAFGEEWTAWSKKVKYSLIPGFY
ncbi:hypothetical protein PC9H_009367 [Pleurotus ostreatus]|uniref:Protein-S-isoprenylcysteine O-methyltransferase n=3 Tax=Pleurotus TaxID=5320 RepID=A0A067NJS1_PLEO1|nr:uncharacterized protein PC9H_009367 [Pleurotus ostreatus]KAF7424066.1 hypothetical protein PC9H_009367 [Pleurotus ostreatus]KAJ8693116.1 hypothetical protein PTI98_010361 [Pleurotus ostreatus]KDQ24322.1 hypothetical protein PLEOSDRAFT_1107247 [Pleurotus ostreatus PC15]